MSERTSSTIYEISSENRIAGRRPIKVVLHEIFPDNTRWQENGISWKEEYVRANLHSVIGMSIVAAFLTEDRDVPYDHGMTEVREEDRLPLFEDATMVGHFDKAYIGDVEIEGVTKRCLIAEGTLDEMRYPKFVAWLREHMAESTVKGSVEIVGKPEHDGYIIYSDGWKDEGRVPQDYDYSGYAILSVKPADEAAIVMELNNKKTDKEDETMDEKTKNELMAAVASAVSEVNSKWEEYWAKVDALQADISQLKADIAQKEADIKQLQADYDKEYAAKEAAELGLTEANAAKEAAEASLNEANAKIAEMENAAAVAELNAALAPYTEEQRAVAQEEIDAFNANPGSVEINSIIGKICTAMVEAARESKVIETNSANQIDVFGMMDDAGDQDDGSADVNVF
jgi:hypothetical protein|nr:MAG TPA: hypothetical protein [Caudoviricetes sp.]